MKNFLIYTLATITGLILASFLFFFVMIASLSVMVASGDKPASIKENSILVLKGGTAVPDRGDQNPFAGFDPLSMTFTPATGLNEILSNLRKATVDDKIKGILIENGLMQSGWATTEEIRDAIIKFREESGKFVIAYSEFMLPQDGYYLSSAADRIYVSPGTIIDFKGLSGEIMFYKNALEKLGVEVQVTRHGKFKGAVEPYMLDKLSNENREQINHYIGSIWKHVVLKISESRMIPEATLNVLADELTGYQTDMAAERGLIDGILFRDQLNDTLKILSGLTTDDKITLVPMTKYTKVPSKEKITVSKNRISVIYASGTIVMGEGSGTSIGGNSYAEIIRGERLDTNVKAIVLRVNSPGGSAAASDLIWREVALASEVKPVVVSMGNYAASGGYYISAPATKIISGPTTISGSIGVFGLLPNAGGLLEKKIGITTETVNTNKHSDFPSLFRSMGSYEKEVMQLSIEKVYSDFVTKVSEGRDLSFEYVDSIGQGRVWSGQSAMAIGLADATGGLRDAVKEAAELAGIEDYSLRELPVAEDPYKKLIEQLSGEVKMKLIKNELGSFFEVYKDLSDLKNGSGIQARLPYSIDIR